MYSLAVYQFKPGTKDTTWVAQLMKNGGPVGWQFVHATTLEHAEAKACEIFREAVFVNGLKVD